MQDQYDILKAHKAFWQGRGMLVRKRPYQVSAGLEIPLAGGTLATDETLIRPDMLNPELFVGIRAIQAEGLGEQTDGGQLLTVSSPIKLPWTEAVMGCPVKLVPSSASFWIEHNLTDVAEAPRYRVQPGNEWLRKLGEFTRVLVARSPPGTFVTQTVMRGPIDMADAMLGTESLFTALALQPGQCQALLEICTEAFIKVANVQWAEIPMHEGGHVNPYGVWAPGTTVRAQTDASAMISAQMYRDLILPFDRQVLGAFDYSIMHTHSGYLQILDALLETDEANALQIGIDLPPAGPPVSDLVAVFNRILDRKPLVITGAVTEADADMLTNKLPRSGVLLDLLIRS